MPNVPNAAPIAPTVVKPVAALLLLLLMLAWTAIVTVIVLAGVYISALLHPYRWLIVLVGAAALAGVIFVGWKR